jgi:ammonia channel protein AmtB
MQGMLAVGFFMNRDNLSGLNNGQVGLFHGGGGYCLGIQAAAAASIIAWSMTVTFIVCIVSSILGLGLGMIVLKIYKEKGVA